MSPHETIGVTVMRKYIKKLVTGKTFFEKTLITAVVIFVVAGFMSILKSTFNCAAFVMAPAEYKQPCAMHSIINDPSCQEQECDGEIEGVIKELKCNDDDILQISFDDGRTTFFNGCTGDFVLKTSALNNICYHIIWPGSKRVINTVENGR